MEKLIIVVVTVPNNDLAKDIARELLKQKLCACVNILPQCLSIYTWQDKIEENNEHILLIKTIDNKYSEIEKLIKKVHTYETPEILKIVIDDGESVYLNWIRDSIK